MQDGKIDLQAGNVAPTCLKLRCEPADNNDYTKLLNIGTTLNDRKSLITPQFICAWETKNKLAFSSITPKAFKKTYPIKSLLQSPSH